eukprot:TRINITY_DN23279_c0_g1_i1.p1 TRINITY_DN23279_c0_g1~~TRINITY_DN23279_c0_g1_i1.p1  ORF type:complete len:665 (+),score=91.45 TRINITY_DN23279_c0_g1_i1:62-1996(+)
MAINLSRSERPAKDNLSVRTSTNELVAPGSYDEFRKEVRESAVPFSSLSERTLNPLPSSAKLTPGPGAYLDQELLESASGADKLPAQGLGQIGFKSKSKRLGPTSPGASVFSESTIIKNPAPDTYTTVGDLKMKLKSQAQPACRPVLDPQDRSMPSIPQMRFLPGQQPETEAAKADAANLLCRHTGELRDLPGPGEYEVQGEAIVHHTDPATVFLPSTGKSRGLWEPTVHIESSMPPHDIPGPGSYDRKPETDPVTERGAVCVFNSSVPMAQDTNPNSERVIPGPGAYEIPGDIEALTAQLKERADAMGGDRYQFGSVTERVGWARSVHQPFKDAYNIHHVPGPGHYPESGTCFKDPKSGAASKVLPDGKKKKLYGVHHPTIILALQEADGPLQAFNSTDDRPCNKELEQKTPAPWQYNREVARGESMASTLRERAKVGRKGVFGSCADRFYGSPLNGREGLPDPSFDGGSANISSDTQHEIGSPFKSSAPRTREAAGPREIAVTKVGSFQTPSPTTYTIKTPNYRSPFRTPRTEHLSFGTSATRFTEKKDLFTKFQLPDENPPPASYDYPASQKRVTGNAHLKAKRKGPINGSTSDQVGPGSYFEDMETTLLRKTFNVTTQAPLSARQARPRMGSNVGQNGIL